MLARHYIFISVLFLTFDWNGGQAPVYASKCSPEAPRMRANYTCRCLSTDACWPSAAAFADLEKQLSKPLLSPTPLAAPCYSAFASSNCLEVKQSWFNSTWRSEHAGQMQYSNFESYIFPNGSISSCPVDTNPGVACGQGSVPVSAADAHSPEDIVATVNFAKLHNLRLVVKNTGHDLLGRSTARGAFMVWTHYMKNITYHATFKPAGAPSNVTVHDIMTLGAGVQWRDAYDAAYAHDRVLVGGLSPDGSVGAAGGWLQGGGYSVFSPEYGLGHHLTVNAHQHSDLFWALRGGGGGTYGIVTSVSYQTYPSTPVIGAFFQSYVTTIAISSPSPILRKLFTELVRVTPALADAGWAGFAAVAPSPPTSALALQFGYIAKNSSLALADTTMSSFFAFAQSLMDNSSEEAGGSLNIISATTIPFPSFYAWEEYLFQSSETSPVGVNADIGSRLLSRTLIEDEHEVVAETLLTLPNLSICIVGGGAVAQMDSDSVGVNPAWRKALVHVPFGQGWPDGASAEIIAAAKQVVKEGIRTLEKLAPRSGAYFNEATLYEPSPKQTFFGSHYDKLLAIKERYDPYDLFVVAEGVGSDKWDAELNCRI